MTKVTDCGTKEEFQGLKKVGKEKSSGSGILKHLILGSLIAVILGCISKYYFFDKIVLTDEKIQNKSSFNQDDINTKNKDETSTKGTFGEEEEDMELLQNDNKIHLEQIPQEDSLEDNDELMFNNEDAILDDEAEYDYHDDIDEDESEDGENESQMDSETLKRILKEDVQLELDEGFATKESENEDSVDINDDAEIDEYEHEVDDDITDNNWSDDESELKRMESQQEQEQQQQQQEQQQQQQEQHQQQ
ncbi:uncharacterized protein cubi_01565 [Cryptosporidium ubiquitum]|uniref:Uncharacterized protein n=1 Tax=Cryptosporidium ubiquitum TaxID=857276 RepID=A0A1J4MDB8_9CRYT|nr:uncharacterized protein cubi_01565 [Cryptosporidium ubiquitum]OII72232.1 hypothetical protein cubi_01565 [Cryptosporidium ubiquitum]